MGSPNTHRNFCRRGNNQRLQGIWLLLPFLAFQDWSGPPVHFDLVRVLCILSKKQRLPWHAVSMSRTRGDWDIGLEAGVATALMGMIHFV